MQVLVSGVHTYIYIAINVAAFTECGQLLYSACIQSNRLVTIKKNAGEDHILGCPTGLKGRPNSFGMLSNLEVNKLVIYSSSAKTACCMHDNL